MRIAILLLALAPSIVMASASGSYAPGVGCPSPRCADTIDVRLNAPRASAGAVFVAILPMKDGGPTLPGAWLTGPETLSVGAAPVAIQVGPIGPYRERFRISGGACAAAAQHGYSSGTFGVYAGYGLVPDELSASMISLEKKLADADPEVREKVAATLERLRALNPFATAAAEDMLTNQTFWPIAIITCRGNR